MALAKVMMDVKSKQDHGTIKQLSSAARIGVQQNFWQISLPLSDDLLFSLIHGNLSLDRKHNNKLNKELEMIYQHARDNPHIYFQPLVDPSTGIGLTKSQIFWLLKRMEKYCKKYGQQDPKIDEHREFIREVDTKHDARHIDRSIDLEEIQNRRYVQKQEHIDNVKEFCKATRQRLKEDGKPDNEPMHPPPCETGYASSDIRHDQHKAHVSSNYIMNLAEALCATGPGNMSRFKMSLHPVCLVYKATHASMAELLFSRLPHVYLENGGGFSHWGAGTSNNKAKQLEDTQWEVIWNKSQVEQQIRAGQEAEINKAQARISALRAELVRIAVATEQRDLQKRLQGLPADELERERARIDTEAMATLTKISREAPAQFIQVRAMHDVTEMLKKLTFDMTAQIKISPIADEDACFETADGRGSAHAAKRREAS